MMSPIFAGEIMVGFAASLLALFLFSTALVAQQTDWKAPGAQVTLELRPKGAPGVSTGTGPEGNTTTARDRVVAGRPVLRIGNGSKQTMSVLRAKQKSSGAAGAPLAVG